MIRYLWDKLLKWGWDYNRDLRVSDSDLEIEQISLIENNHVTVDGLNFTVMPAQGGTIVQLRKYDRKNNSNDMSTHIIAEGQDVAETVGKIVALELWKA
jgi:hypothetical protein